MAGIKRGAAYSTGASAMASRRSYNKKRLAAGDKKRKEANRRKAEQKKRDDQKMKQELALAQQRELELEQQKGRNLALLLETQKDRGQAYQAYQAFVNDSSTQHLLARAVVGPTLGATVPSSKVAAAVREPELSEGEEDETVAAVREPELSDGEIEEDESVSLVRAGSNVPIGKSVDRFTKQFAKPAPSAHSDQLAWVDPMAPMAPMASPIPRKRNSAPFSPLIKPSLVGLLQANIGTPSKLVGVKLLEYSEDDITACARFEQHDARRYHLVQRLAERSGLKFPEQVAVLLRMGTIERNPTTDNNNSTLAVAYVDEKGVCHWFPFNIVVNFWMSIRTYFAHSPLRRGEDFQERREFVLKGLRWLAETFGVPFEEVVSYIVAAVSMTELHKLGCGASSPSTADIAILRVIEAIKPTDREFAILSDIPCASSMGDFEAWIVAFHNIPRVEAKFSFMQSVAWQRYELSLEFDPNRHPELTDEGVCLEFWQGFLRSKI